MIRNFLFAILCPIIALHSNTGFAQTVGGKLGTEPTTAMIVPDSPTTEDEILFMLAADGVTHGNACGQLAALGGNEFTISIDAASGIIDIGLTGPAPQVCTADFVPTNGLQGSIGPLPAGA